MGSGSEEFNVGLAHDWLVGLRGGERVLDRLAQQFGPTDLYTLVNNGRFHTEAIARCRIVTSPLQHLPGASGRLRRSYLPLMPWAVQRLRVEPCDVLISTSSAVMKSIRPPRGAKHLCYCHSPARYVWDQVDDYAHGAGGRWRRLGLRAVRRRFRRWDRATADRVDRFLANSRHTARRIKRCYGREAAVIPPPVRTEYFTPCGETRREDWYLVVSALEPYKRTDLVIEAANEAKLNLKVAGAGSQADALRASCGPTVQMLGRVDDEALRRLYRTAAALIFPQVEDFGIVAVEAQATGCPVIACQDGGALDTVTPETGVLFGEQNVDALLAAVRDLDRAWAVGAVNTTACRANAERFSERAFDEAIRREVESLVAGDP